MDVVVPLDVFVVDSDYTNQPKVKRKRSNQVITDFSNCGLQLLDNLKAQLK
jgi:hypothetical protein